MLIKIYYISAIVARVKNKINKGKKGGPSAAAGSEKQLQESLKETSPRKDVPDSKPSSCDEAALLDSEIIPPSQPSTLKLSWINGNVDTISVSSSISELGKYVLHYYLLFYLYVHIYFHIEHIVTAMYNFFIFIYNLYCTECLKNNFYN